MKIRDYSTIKVLAFLQSCSEFLILNRKTNSENREKPSIFGENTKLGLKFKFFSHPSWEVRHQKQFYVIKNHLNRLVEIGQHVREVSLSFQVVITCPVRSLAVRRFQSEVDSRPEAILDYFHYRPMKRKKKTDL